MARKIKPNAARRNRAYLALRSHTLRSGKVPETVTMESALTELLTDIRLLAAQNGKDMRPVIIASREAAAALLSRPDTTTKHTRKISDRELADFVAGNCPTCATPGAVGTAAGGRDDDY